MYLIFREREREREREQVRTIQDKQILINIIFPEIRQAI